MWFLIDVSPLWWQGPTTNSEQQTGVGRGPGGTAGLSAKRTV